MRNLSFHSLVLIGFMVSSCSTPVSTLKPLPSKWVAKTHSTSDSSCSSLHEISKGSFQLCSGSPSSKSAGRIKFFDQSQNLLTEVTLESRDPLALSPSITIESAWARSEHALYVGTYDGRILKFNYQGERLGTHLLKMPTWVQHLAWKNGKLYVSTARHSEVKLLSLNADLLIEKTFSLPDHESEAEWVLGEKSLYLSTHLGHVYEIDYNLQLKNHWILGQDLELGKPLIVKNSLWVGDSEGVVYKISDARVQKHKLGQGPISSAPIRTKHGLWVAFDEEGVLRLVDQQFKVIRSIKLPITRSFTDFESINYNGHTLMRTSSQGLVTLLSSKGEILVTAEGDQTQIEFTPESLDDLAQDRLPASGI